MTLDDVRTFEGQRVSVSLEDCSRLDDAILEGVVDGDRVWLHVDGEDVFVGLDDVLDVWAPGGNQPAPGWTRLGRLTQ